MWITALLGMITKTVEVTLSVYYRNTDEKGNPYGGPTYYMEKGLGEEKNFKYWKVPAILFGLGIFTTFLSHFKIIRFQKQLALHLILE